jgi:hypothetical protein
MRIQARLGTEPQQDVGEDAVERCGEPYHRAAHEAGEQRPPRRVGEYQDRCRADIDSHGDINAPLEIPFRGDGSSLFLLAAIGLGLLLSTLARTQQQAFALNFFLVNPFFILSGFAFPIAAMPKVLQWFTLINPLRYFLVVIRSVFLKGAGLDVLWPDLAAMALLGAGMFALSILRFRKSLD